ncbi:hypothetical protein, partial [Geotalea sp. SG265]|uniref:hypothetical protein n=1 Tax=Geotalea sp. SG265 TaxID=2922867 RepID=UPI001FAEF36D
TCCYNLWWPVHSQSILYILDEGLVILATMTPGLMSALLYNWLNPVVPVNSIRGIFRTVTLNFTANTRVMPP